MPHPRGEVEGEFILPSCLIQWQCSDLWIQVGRRALRNCEDEAHSLPLLIPVHISFYCFSHLILLNLTFAALSSGGVIKCGGGRRDKGAHHIYDNEMKDERCDIQLDVNNKMNRNINTFTTSPTPLLMTNNNPPHTLVSPSPSALDHTT